MGVDELINDQRRHGGPVEGVVASDPDAVDDPIDVYVVGFGDRETKLRNCAWLPRGDTWPSEDDVCAVAFTDANTPVVVMWWPGKDWPNG